MSASCYLSSIAFVTECIPKNNWSVCIL